MTEAMLVAFRLLSQPVRPFLLVTARRARAIDRPPERTCGSVHSVVVLQEARLTHDKDVAVAADMIVMPLDLLEHRAGILR